jgi:hypothetical protein
MAAKQGRASLMQPRAMARPNPNIPVMPRKKGGEVESKAMHAKEERQIKGIKSELKSHAGKPASKAHKGLAAGGMPKYATGGVVQKFADGGFAKVACKDGGGFKAMKKGNC